MIDHNKAGQGRRVLARCYDWILFTIALIVIQIAVEYMALAVAWEIHEWLSIEQDIHSLIRHTFPVPDLPILVSDEPVVQFWAKMMFITPMVLVFLYELALVALCGQTVGKMMTGVRVVRFDDGQLPGWGRSARRWLALYGPMLIPSVGWLIVLVVYVVSSRLDPHGRALHDRLAGTIVVAEQPPNTAG